MVFDGRLRLDLLSLYAFFALFRSNQTDPTECYSYAWCRVCDDLIDNASSVPVASADIHGIRSFLGYAYTSYSSSSSPSTPHDLTKAQLDTSLPLLSEKEKGPFRLLTSLPVTRGPLEELLAGFETDLKFLSHDNQEEATLLAKPSKKEIELPIKSDEDLMDYSSNVASSVADLCVQLVFAHSTSITSTTPQQREKTLQAARKMGKALQLVNIARDVPADQKINRMYLPSQPIDASIESLTGERRRLLEVAKGMAKESRVAIEGLPSEARGGIRAACDVYLSIGRAVEDALDKGRIEERARVGKFKRAKTAWNAL